MTRSTWGSIRSRAKGVHEIRYTVGGEPRSETVRGTRKQAEQRKAELQVEFGPDDRKGVPITVRGCWKRYYHPYVEEHKAASTVSGYESAYLCHVDPEFGTQEMERVRPIEVQAWLDGMTYGAARKAYAVIRAMYNYAENKDLIEKNPLSKHYDLPKKSKRANRAVCDEVMSAAVLDEVFAECRGEPWEAGFILSAFAGLRREEAVGTQRGDIVFRPSDGFAIVSISRGVQVISGEVCITGLKTDESERTAVVPMPYAARLQELVDADPDEAWLLDDGFGNPANPDTLSCSYKRWFSTHPYNYVPWKNLRNSYATVLHERGVDLGMVAKMLGHTTPIITFKHYDKPSIEAIANAAARFVS